MHPDIKVPIVKNLIYAIKIVFKADKLILPMAIIQDVFGTLMITFVQGILFLKVLLTIIENKGDFRTYVKALFAFLLIGFISELITYIAGYISSVSQKKVFKSMNNLIFDKAADVDISCFEDPAFYDSYQRATQILTGSIIYVFCSDMAVVIGSLISFIAIIGVIVTIDPAYLIFLLPCALVFIIELYKSKLLFKRDMEMTTNNRIKGYTQRTVFLKDYAKDMRTSNIFAVMFRRYSLAVERNLEIIKTYGWRLFFFSMIASFFGEMIPIVGTYSYATYQFIANSGLDISGFSVVLSSINAVRGTTMSIADSMSNLANLALYFQNLRDFFNYEKKVTDGPLEAGEFESLELIDVCFTYPGADKPSLTNVNLKLTKGQTAALVGINGAGKTTLVKLLLRFYDPDSGQILYNGHDIKEYSVESYRGRFATVFQDYKTFAVSVNENVLCHECTEEEKLIAEEALKKSGAWEKVKSLPQGADSVLTREFDAHGAGLSGGEIQKTAVARMFARQFDIAILDEPSSALDPIAEYKMYENLVSATKDKTVIYISHRLSSAVLSDVIYVLNQGTVIESGNHHELMEKGGEYHKMFSLQASSYEGQEVTHDA